MNPISFSQGSFLGMHVSETSLFEVLPQDQTLIFKTILENPSLPIKNQLLNLASNHFAQGENIPNWDALSDVLYDFFSVQAEKSKLHHIIWLIQADLSYSDSMSSDIQTFKELVLFLIEALSEEQVFLYVGFFSPDNVI
jgi:hypothetical protein